jgi:hypothetical protein
MRAFALLLVLVPLAGCSMLGESTEGDLAVLQDLAPFEVRLRLHNPTGHDIAVDPSAFRLVGADGVVFQGTASDRPDALPAAELGPDRTAEGWVAFQVGAYAERPMTLVYESGGVMLETTLPDA